VSELARARVSLERFRNADGGFGLHPGHPSEPEPTAMAAIALDDDDARTWLAEHQRDDGSFGIADGPFADDAATPLAALALPGGTAREAALDHVEATHGRMTDPSEAIPLDGSIAGWGWTGGTASWVEPTARALWALRRFRPDSPRVADAIALLRDRESVGGGWNYGNRSVLGADLPPNAVTTSISLIAARGLDTGLEQRGIEALRRIWRTDTPGPLTFAMSIVAFDLHGSDADAEVVRADLEVMHDGSLDEDAIATAWLAMADGANGQVFP
jgi:hypothetical protein